MSNTEKAKLPENLREPIKIDPAQLKAALEAIGRNPTTLDVALERIRNKPPMIMGSGTI